MESEYVYPELMDRSPTGQWENEGSRDIFERSGDKARELLDSHFPNYFGNAMDAKVRERFPIRISELEMSAGGRVGG